MTHTFNLCRPSADISAIRLIVSHGGRVYRKNTGISIKTKMYDGRSKYLAAKFKDAEVYDALRRIEIRLLEKEQQIMTQDEVEAAMSYALTGDEAKAKKKGKPGFWPYFDEFSSRDCPSKRFRRLAYKKIKEVMGDGDDWDDIDGDWFFRFQQRMRKDDYSLNYISTLTNKLRAVMREGQMRGFHTNEAYKDFSHRFETADTIYLNKAEIERLWELKLSSQEERKARDLFMLGYLTASRYQNYSKLSLDNITEGKIRFIQPKTGGQVVIPCSPKVEQILKRWGGKAPALAEVNINTKIKDVCRKAGIRDKVETRITRGGRTVISVHEKWELVSTHTARRSGATNLYLEGVPIRVCRFLTGHRDDSTFLKYIKVTREEGADLLAKADFFK